MQRPRILFLGKQCPLLAWLAEREPVRWTEEAITADDVKDRPFIVVFGYYHIIPPEVIELCTIVNLHPSLLPHNRGSYPNAWSFLLDTPKGVTVHYVDAGIDTGDIIVQREIVFPWDAARESLTLKSTWDVLQDAVQELFKEHWGAIKSGRCPRIPQPKGLLARRRKDFPMHVLTNGWDTPVSVLDSYAADSQMSAQSYDNEIGEIEKMEEQGLIA